MVKKGISNLWQIIEENKRRKVKDRNLLPRLTKTSGAQECRQVAKMLQK